MLTSYTSYIVNLCSLWLICHLNSNDDSDKYNKANHSKHVETKCPSTIAGGTFKFSLVSFAVALHGKSDRM